MNAISHNTLVAALETADPKPRANREAFDAALAAYNLVKAENSAKAAARKAFRASVYEAAPLPASLIRPDGVAMESEWQTRQRRHPAAELRPAMKAALAEWLPRMGSSGQEAGL